MNTPQLIQLRRQARALDPIVRIGKGGLTPELIAHIGRALTKRKLIKVKFLKSFTDLNDVDAALKEIAKALRCEIVDHVGGVGVLAITAHREPASLREQSRSNLFKHQGGRKKYDA